MIKIIFLLLFLYTSLLSLSMFTLDKVQNFKIHFINSAGFLSKEEEVDLMRSLLDHFFLCYETRGFGDNTLMTV